MKIKRLELSGFKSFVDRTIVTFDHEIMGIVGPNGCGKSNIIDAVRWCMGEQSAKHLRGKAMEDVIFAGSESRSAGGLAEVSLTFENVSIGGPREAQSEIDLLDEEEEALEDEALASLDEGRPAGTSSKV